MALIKPRSRGKRLVRHRTRLDHQTNETLYAYAAFIGESTEYVLNQVIDEVLARDKEFVQWRANHPDLCAPAASGNRRHVRHLNGRAPAASTPGVASSSVVSGSAEAR